MNCVFVPTNWAAIKIMLELIERHMGTHKGETEYVNNRQRTVSEQHMNTHTGETASVKDHQQIDSEQQMYTHTGETDMLDDLMLSRNKTSSPNNIQTNIPIPKARSNYISHSQPMNTTSICQKRPLSLSP